MRAECSDGKSPPYPLSGNLGGLDFSFILVQGGLDLRMELYDFFILGEGTKGGEFGHLGNDSSLFDVDCLAREEFRSSINSWESRECSPSLNQILDLYEAPLS